MTNDALTTVKAAEKKNLEKIENKSKEIEERLKKYRFDQEQRLDNIDNELKPEMDKIRKDFQIELDKKSEQLKNNYKTEADKIDQISREDLAALSDKLISKIIS